MCKIHTFEHTVYQLLKLIDSLPVFINMNTNLSLNGQNIVKSRKSRLKRKITLYKYIETEALFWIYLIKNANDPKK